MSSWFETAMGNLVIATTLPVVNNRFVNSIATWSVEMMFYRTIPAMALVQLGVHSFSSMPSVARRSSPCGDAPYSLAGRAINSIPNGGRHGAPTIERRYYATRRCDRTRLSAARSAKKGDRKASSSPGGGGFGGGGAASSPSASATTKPPSKEALAKRLQQVYGGTSPQDIAAGTQRRVERAFQGLPSHLKVITTLYQEVTLWDERLSRLSLLEQSQLPPGDVEGAQLARKELESLCARHNVTQNQLHNLFQQITWDSSADAKAARAVASNGQMPADIGARVDRACSIVAEAVVSRHEKNQGGGRCLDVGCGFGVLVPHLVKAGVPAERIVGVDLSPEMIRNAQEQHGTAVRSGKRGGGGERVGSPTFVACDFLNEYDDPKGFDGIIFCMSLHDMPDPIQALDKACRLLRPEGSLVVVHPQGSAHVRKQHFQNPVLVRRGLPDANELALLTQTTIVGMELVTPPAPDGSVQESNEGYLFVLKRKR